MEQNQIIINEEKREQKARHYCEYTFKRFGIDADTQEAQLIRSAHVHGYNAGFEAARDEMQKMMNYTHQSESIPVPNSMDELEKEIKAKYFPYEGLSFEFYRQIAKYFANWQREQMMQGALDAEMEDFPDGSFICKTKNLIDDDMEARGISLFDYASVKILLIKK